LNILDTGPGGSLRVLLRPAMWGRRGALEDRQTEEALADRIIFDGTVNGQVRTRAYRAEGDAPREIAGRTITTAMLAFSETSIRAT
jgi:hypothetical protein